MVLVACAGACGKHVMSAQDNLDTQRDESSWYCTECFELEKELRAQGDLDLRN